MTTPRFSFVEWLTGTTEPEVLHNTLALKTDIFLAGGVKSRTTSVEPTSPAPSEGDCYIIPASSPAASGAAWSSFTPNYVAVYYDGAWVQYAPPGRFLTYVDDEALLICWNGSAYVQVTATVTNKFDATAAPTSADDASLGYGEGSIWVDVTNDRAYICLSATATSPASAVWREIGDPVLHNMAASAPPAGTDSAADGYSVGSRWFDTTNDEIYFCIDDGSGSSPEVAIWKQVGSGAGAGGLTPVFVSGSHTAAASEAICALTATAAATIPVTLPAGNDGDQITIDDFEDSAGTYNITITPDGSETVDGDTSYTININGGGLVLVYRATGTDWKVAYRTPGSSTGPIGALSDVDTATATPAAGDLLRFNGTEWVPSTGGRVIVWTDNMNDDTAYSLDLGASVFNGDLTIVSNDGVHRGIIAFRAAASGNFLTAIASSGLSFTTGALTGTTGADATVTVSVTDQTLYIENRSGGVRHFHITINTHWMIP